jgi:penicillin-binding protein 2
MAFLGQEEQIRELQDRFRYLYAAVFIGLGLLVSRLVFLQILSGEKMRQYSEENRIKRVKVAAPRGMIFDRNKTLLIDNRPAFDLEVIPQYLKESKQTKQVVARLSTLVHMSETEINEILDKARFQPSFMPVKIKTDLSRDEVAEIESWKIEMPGVEVREEIKRTNIYGEIASHLLGYIGEVNSTELPVLNKGLTKYKLGDNVGKFGLEQRLEETLRGIDGEELKEVDALGRIKLDKGKGRVLDANSTKNATPGKNLILTIDQDLQLAANKAFGNHIGSVVAIDPRSGEILAMLSRPSFDPTEFSRGISPAIWNRLLSNPNHPLRDKTLQDHYPPGSTFKTLTAIAGLQEGVIDENTTFNCTGSMRLGNRTVHCWSKHGHGNMNVVSALTQSCDVFFYKLALKLKSVDDIARWAFKFGLGTKTGINLAREVPGLIPTEEWKQKRFNQPWNTGETLNVAIGQGFVLTTALQLANMYATIANGGTLYKPFIVKEVESNEGQKLQEFKPQVVGSVQISEKTEDLINQGLWGVVNSPHGTAYASRLSGIDFVGKTGTAQTIRLNADKLYGKCESWKFQDRHNALFVGFAPLKNPVIAVAVIGEHACHGASSAAPIAKAVIKTYLEKYYPEIYGEKAISTRMTQSKNQGKTFLFPVTQDNKPRTTSGDQEDISPDQDQNGYLPEAAKLPPLIPPRSAQKRGAPADSQDSSDPLDSANTDSNNEED